MRGSVGYAAALLALCLGVVVVGYGGSAHAYWVADDFILIDGQVRADGVLGLLGLGKGTPFFRPWGGVSFWLDWQLAGHHLETFHWHGFALHALVAASLGLLARAWSGRRLAGLVAAAGFATYPLHPEAVTWISGRVYPLAACWTVIATLVAYSSAVRGVRRAATLTAAAGALALLSAEAAIPLVAYATLLVWGERRGFDRATRVRLGALVVVTLGYLLVRWLWLGGVGGYRRGGESVHLAPEFGRIVGFVVDALAQLVQPSPHDGEDVGGWLGTIWTVGFALLFASVRFTASGIRVGVALILCVLAGLSVVASWATLGRDLAGVRYLYIPSLWLMLGVGTLSAHAWERGGPSRWVGVAATVALLSVQVPLLRMVNARWERSGLLAEQVLAGLRARHEASGTMHFLVHGVPAEYRGAHALPWGIEAAAARFVGPVRVEVVEDAAAWALVVATAEQASEAQRRGVALGTFDAASGTWSWQ